jgi:uncharacterized phage-associated protein
MRYCDVCKADKHTTEITIPGTVLFRGIEINFDKKIIECDLGHRVYDESVDEHNLREIMNQYTIRKFGVEFSRICEVRKQYEGLGIRPFAKILNIGSATISRLEAMELPTDKYVSLFVKLINDPESIYAYYRKNKESLTPREQKQIEQVLATKIGTEPSEDEVIIERIHSPLEGTEVTGFTTFNLDKFVHMILYFARKGVNKTKLMKLLWYSDFVNYRRQNVAISGAVYTRYPYGPVPKDHDITLAHLKHLGVIDIEEQENEQGWTLMTVRSKQQFNPDLFENTELGVLEEINSFFSKFGSNKISKYSHKEQAWIETPEGTEISYEYATILNELH